MLARLHVGTGERTKGLYAGSNVGDGHLCCYKCGEKIRGVLKPGSFDCADCHAVSQITKELIERTRGKNGKYNDEEI